MDINSTSLALAALAQPTRLAVFRLIMKAGPAGLSAGFLADAAGVPQNTLSTHVATLVRAGLVRARRDGRQIFYGADLAGAGRILADLVHECCDGQPELCGAVLDAVDRTVSRPLMETETMSAPSKNADRPFNVLFLCTGNSARSVIAEAILNRVGAGRFRGFSAGSHPKGTVHPQTLEVLKRLNHDISQLRSKSWAEFSKEGAPELDFVFTVCDNAANEVCPVWPGQPMTAHWGVPDPALATGTPAEIGLAFSDAYRMLNNRISVFVSLPLKSLDRLTLQKRLKEIGTMTREPVNS